MALIVAATSQLHVDQLRSLMHMNHNIVVQVFQHPMTPTTTTDKGDNLES